MNTIGILRSDTKKIHHITNFISVWKRTEKDMEEHDVVQDIK